MTRPTPRTILPFLNGQYTKQLSPPSSTPLYNLLNPTTNQIHSHYHPSTSHEIQSAISSTSTAQPIWSSIPPPHRSQILHQTATILQQRSDELSQLETLETGRPITETRFDLVSAIDCLQYHASLLRSSVSGTTHDLNAPNWGYTLREPFGLTVGIGAWNYPLVSAISKIVPSLTFGNGMVYKPSEETPSTSLCLAECMTEAGVPPGTINVVLGGGDVGHELVSHPHVKKVSFTGSVATGKTVYQSAARGLKKVTLELGGKSPLIIWDDANLKEVVKGAMMANWYSNGQVCSNGTRVFVHESLYEEFLELLVRETDRLVVGDPMSSKTHIGPMISRSHKETVERYIRLGIEEGATLYYQKDIRLVSEEEHLRQGNFIAPVIFTNVRDDMRIAHEEIFGMVMCVFTFTDEEEVIRRANDTNFGLAAGIFTDNLQRAHRICQKLNAGVVWINQYNVAPMELPWGGVNDSGIGRENGWNSVEEWTQVKSVFVGMEEEMESPYGK